MTKLEAVARAAIALVIIGVAVVQFEANWFTGLIALVGLLLLYIVGVIARRRDAALSEETK